MLCHHVRFLLTRGWHSYYYRDDELRAVPFDVLDSLIRMGNKYCVRTVLRDALSRLQKYYSNDLSTWCDNTKGRAQYVAASEPRSAIQTINVLAPLTNTPSLLPSAFLMCCGLIEPMVTEIASPFGVLGMSADDVLRVISGTAALTRAGVDHIVGLVTAIPGKACLNHSAYTRVARKALSAHQEDASLHEMQRYTAAFMPLHGWFWGTEPTRLPCEDCQAQSRRRDEERCRDSWLQLPALFNLAVDGWPDRTHFADKHTA